MLRADELKQLAKPTALASSWMILFDWLSIAAIISAALYFNHLAAYVVAFLLVARYQHALFMLMHEASHYALFRSARANDLVGQYLLAGPLILSLSLYRSNHLDHHQTPVSPFTPYPTYKLTFATELLEDAFGVSYWSIMNYFLFRPQGRRFAIHKQSRANTALMLQYLDAQGPSAEMTPEVRARFLPGLSLRYDAQVIGSALLGNAAVFALFYAWGRPWLYPILWLLPMASALMVMFRVRGVSEHGGLRPNKAPELCTRTILDPLWAYVFHPHQGNYHIEHHLYPQVPCYNLRAVHKLLAERGRLPEKNLYRRYWDVLSRLVY